LALLKKNYWHKSIDESSKSNHLKKNTLRHKPITKRPKYELLYCRVAVLACRRFGLSPFWSSSYCSVAVMVCRRFGVAVLACRRFGLSPF